MVKTKIAPTATKHILTIIEDDLSKIEQKITAVWHKKKNGIALAGFRKGHVPREHAENVIGFTNLYEDVIQEVVLEGVEKAEDKIVGVGEVAVEMFTEKQPIVLRTEVWLQPGVQLNSQAYKGIDVEVDDPQATDGEVDAFFQTKREEAAVVTTTAEPAQAGDVLTLSWTGVLEETGKPFKGNELQDQDVVLGSKYLIEGFEEQLIGVRGGETKQVEIFFPETWPIEEVRGKKALYTVEVKEVKNKALPELDDEFAKQLGYESLTDARQKVSEDICKNKEQQQQILIDNQLLAQLQMKCATDPLPECIVNQEINRMFNELLTQLNLSKDEYLKKSKKTSEEVAAEFSGRAQQNIRTRLILEAIANEENLVPTDEEREARYQEYQKAHSDLTMEQIRERVSDALVEHNLKIQKALDFVREHCNKKPKQKVVTPTQPAVEEVAEVNG